jgi:hypothetical protein
MSSAADQAEETDSAVEPAKPHDAPAVPVPTRRVMISTRLTPYTTVPRHFRWARAARWRERALNLLIFAALPTALFWIWYTSVGVYSIPPDYDRLLLAAPLSALIVSVGPLVFQQGEYIYEQLLRTISRDGADGWNVRLIQEKIDQLDRLYARVTIPLAVATAASVGYVFHDIGDIAPLASTPARVGAVVVLAFLGLISGTAIWGAVKVAIIVHTITGTASPTWSPFRRDPHALHELFRFAWSNGVLFSVGNITVPALVVVMPRLSLASKIISWSFISITFVGGLLLFVLTSRWLFAMADRQRGHALDKLAPTLEDLAERVPLLPTMRASETVRLRNGLEAVMMLRRHIESSTPAPVSRRTIVAATSTLVIPVLLTVVQTFAARLLP